MDALPPEQVRYGDKEIAKILRRASELQRAAPSRPDPSGLTLAELEDIAREAGIDVDYLRQAAAETRGSSDSSLMTRFLGAPLLLRLERVIEGELPVNASDSLVPILQTSSDATGQVSTVGKALTWTSSGGSNARRMQVLVHAQNGQTVIRLEERSDDTAAALHIGLGSGSFAGAIPAALAITPAAGILAGLGVGAAIVAGFWGLARAIYRSTTNKRRVRLERVFEQLVDAVRSRVSAGPLVGSQPAKLTSGERAPAETRPPGVTPDPDLPS